MILRLNLRSIFYHIALSCIALAGCSPGNQQAIQRQEIDLLLDVDPSPPMVGPSHLVVTLTETSGVSLKGAAVNVEGSMDHGEMQPMLANLRGIEDGNYEAPFVWTMAGDWTMAVTATLLDGQEITKEFQMIVNDAGQEHDNHLEKHPPRVPNEGAVIRILEPSDGTVYAPGSDIRVAVEFDEFDLSDEGNHWHIYDNGMSSQMVMGGINDATLRDLKPGKHELSVYMSVGSHEELEDGTSVTIIVSE